MKREIIIDTETTGLETEDGHRIIEIGCVELIDREITGNHYHVYLNPDRSIDEGALRVHGITLEFLKDKPVFANIAEEFLAFLQDSTLIIHNAPFDVKFINHEFNLISAKKYQPIEKKLTVIDTLKLARKLYPGQRNSLDALCKRHAIDNSDRSLHGALLDARLLARVYLAMTGGQTTLFDLAHDRQIPVGHQFNIVSRDYAVHKASDLELEHHKHYLQTLRQKNSKPSLWETLETGEPASA